jgi:hypothetical protein
MGISLILILNIILPEEAERIQKITMAILIAKTEILLYFAYEIFVILFQLVQG